VSARKLSTAGSSTAAHSPPLALLLGDHGRETPRSRRSRRLKSDRFFTDDFRPEVYTPAGLKWILDNDMRSVLLRHFPQLEPALEGVANPFAPWRRVPSRSRRTEAAGTAAGA
jgi:hypothetical protein